MSKSPDSSAVLDDEYSFSDPETMMKVLGPRGEHLAVMQKELGVSMGQRGQTLHLKGAPALVTAGLRLIDQLARTCRNGRRLREGDVIRGSRILAADPTARLDDIFNDVIHVNATHRVISPKGLAQKRYVDTIRKMDLTFAIGPAGTGKTYLAVATAVAEMVNRRHRRIVLTRPAVEAGERLGFLPGNMVEKINPYLRPLYDALHDMLDPDKTQSLIASGRIEIAPLAFMRGRTLNDSFVILDEAQNTTRDQMKMFLTRLGYSSKAVVTGDVTQVDLPEGAISGLIDAERLLNGIDGIGFCRFTEVDVVRHPLVQDIIKAYDARTANNQRGQRVDESD
ncbi:MAG: PhoH family protein [Deltaproteobacteria bacterium]|nr:PhoH family protein [Deltaproteobacteria bacterium]